MAEQLKPFANLVNSKSHDDNKWDWAPFNGCFGESGIKISDIDGIVEKKGQFLYIEGKSGYYRRSLPPGTLKMHWALCGHGFTVVVFWGNPPDISTVSHIQVKTLEKRGSVLPATGYDLKNFISEWFKKSSECKYENTPKWTWN